MSYPLLLLFATIYMVRGAPTSNVAPNVEVIWTLDKPTSQVSLRAWTTDYSTLLGEVCGTTLNTGNFAKSPLAFDVDDNGYGFGYGTNTYKVNANPDQSGGIVCHKRYNDQFARVNCVIPYQGTSQDPLDINEEAACFPGEVLRLFHSSNAPASAQAMANMTGLVSSNHKRNDCGDPFESPDTTVMVGDGSPRQTWFNRQLTPNTECSNAPSCSATYTSSKGVSFSWSAEIDPVEWISGGFDVEISFETGTEQQCSGGPGDVICVWYQTAYTAYTVQNMDGCGRATSHPYIMYSPNKNQDLQYARQFYCVDGPCRSSGSGYWDNSGSAGGPPS